MTQAVSLPEGWTWTTVGDIVTFEYGKGLTEGKRDQTGRIPVYGSNGIVGYHSVPLIIKPCLIVGRKGAAGAVHMSTVPCWPIDTTYFVFPPETVNLLFLYYLFSSLNFVSLDRSTAIPGLNRNDAYAVKIPFPPLPEQARIVARIEELFTQLEAGTAALRRVQAGLKRYKASVLKAAVEGKLFGHAVGATRRVAPPGDEDLPSLPEGWRLATLEELSSEANYGTSQKCDYDKNEFPVVRIPNIISGNIDLADLKYAIDGSGLREKDSLMPGDLLIIRTNGSRDLIGKSALVRKSWGKPICFASYLIRFRIKDAENVGAWIAAIWDSPLIRIWLEKEVATTAGQYNLNIAKLNKLPIPLPPLAEQRRIVGELERRLSVAKAVESAVGASLARAARLRQAVLRSAFEGRLV